METIKRKRNWYLFLSIAGVFAVASALFLFIDAYNQKNNMKAFMRGVMFVGFSIIEVSYISKYLKLRKTS